MLPEGIPTVRVTGRYLTLDGRPLAGRVVWRAPSLLTFPNADVILGGPTTVQLDATGAFSVELPATDAPDMHPTGWSYQVAEQLAGVANRAPYHVLLPAESPDVDIDDLAPTDPATPTYVAVRGDSAYEVAVAEGFEGTVEQWLATLVGPRGEQGDRGETGAPGANVYEVAVAEGFEGTVEQWLATLVGPRGEQGDRGETGAAGPPGVVQSINGQSASDVVLDATDIGAVPATAPGAPGGVAQLDDDGKVPAEQLPPGGGGAVDSVNGQRGTVVLDATDVGALPTTARGTAGGVAALGPDSKVSAEQLPPAPALPGVWLPSDYGLAGWSYDLHAHSRTPGDMPGEAQRLYLVGVPLRTPKTVTQVAVHVMGYDKPNSTVTNARFGIYDASFKLLSSSGDAKAQIPELHNIGGALARITIPSVALPAGLYYVAILVKGTAAASPYFAATNWTGNATTAGAVAPSASGVHRWLQTSATNLTTLPDTLTQASFTEAQTCYWAAIV